MRYDTLLLDGDNSGPSNSLRNGFIAVLALASQSSAETLHLKTREAEVSLVPVQHVADSLVFALGDHRSATA